MPTYKTTDGLDRTVPGVGQTVGGKITTDVVIENPMFELVSEAAAEAPAQPAPAQAAVTPVEASVTPEEKTKTEPQSEEAQA